MSNLSIAYNDATPTQRNFAYACAVTHGYSPYDDVFWKLFMTPPIKDEHWYDLTSAVALVVLTHFKTGIILMPLGFNDWIFADNRWHSLATV